MQRRIRLAHRQRARTILPAFLPGCRCRATYLSPRLPNTRLGSNTPATSIPLSAISTRTSSLNPRLVERQAHGAEPGIVLHVQRARLPLSQCFFPNATTYVMAGLEPVGPIPDLMCLPRGSVAEALRHIEGSLSTILKISFFKTHDMRMTLGASRMNGALPLLYVFLARSGNAIQDVSLIKLDAQGMPQPENTPSDPGMRNAAHGVKIVFVAQTPASGPSITSARILPTTASGSAVLRNSAIGLALGTHSSSPRPTCSTAPTFPTSAASSSGTPPRSSKTTPAYRSAISDRLNGSCVRSVAIPVQLLCSRATISPN